MKVANTSRLKLTLQSKMVLLTLLPMLVLALVLSLLEVRSSMTRIEETLAEQREVLVDERETTVRYLVESARNAISHLVDNPNLSEADAQAEAQQILQNFRFGNENYVFAFSYDGTAKALAAAPQRIDTNMSGITDSEGNAFVDDLIERARSGNDSFYDYLWINPATGEIEPKHSLSIAIPEWDWMIGTGIYLSDIDEGLEAVEAQAWQEFKQDQWQKGLVTLLLLITVGVVMALLVRRALSPIRHAAAAMSEVASGDADLTKRLTVETDDEVGNLARQFNAFIERIQLTLQDVNRTTQSVLLASREIDQGTNELASRTEQAAANLQQTSSSVEEITSTVYNTTEGAEQASQLSNSAVDVARQGNSAMQRVESTMAEIDQSATQIGEIITMMDAIAFQTNILALNASVEAARAGEHGRGFAVVAEEVRKLAGRSSEAAGEIRQLIDNSVKRTREGSELVHDAGATMQEIVDSVTRVTDVIAEISAGAREQNSGISEINKAVAEMDSMTQQNATMVQQSATAAQQLREGAERLSTLLAAFVLGDSAASTALPSQASSARPASDMPSRSPSRQLEHEHDEWDSF